MNALKDPPVNDRAAPSVTTLDVLLERLAEEWNCREITARASESTLRTLLKPVLMAWWEKKFGPLEVIEDDGTSTPPEDPLFGCTLFARPTIDVTLIVKPDQSQADGILLLSAPNSPYQTLVEVGGMTV